MGQRQSTSSGEQEEAPAPAPAKTDYYELLGVERTASEDEIKKAYRRKALELHPDRNYGNVENATRLFAEIQSAYEVLSDSQERAWYDSHRDILLRGDQPTGPGADEFSYNIRMTTAEEVMKLMMKFNGRMEFNNSPSGFFGGLNDFFKQLAKEEDIACQWEDQEGVEYPEFGTDNDEYEDVVRPFYAVWNGFATKKSYSWKDEYRISEAPDRRIRRLMEKENKKLREDAAQEYNEAVRSLVAFVRKRDPRVQNNQKSEAERQKALREATAAQAARSRAARQAKLEELDAAVVPDWAKSKSTDEREGGFSSESDLEEHEYDCVVCDKTFKSEAQLKTHEKSKKHVKQLKQLQREMRAEGRDLDLGSSKDVSEREQNIDEHGSIGDEDAEITSAHDDSNLSLPDDASEKSELPKQTNGTVNTLAEDVDVSASSGDDDYAPRSEVEQRLTAEVSDHLPTRLEDISLEGTPAPSDLEGSSQPKIGKAKQKRAKKAAQQSAQQSTGGGGEFQCLTCKAGFPSKPQLFKHLEEKPKHAAPLTQTKVAKGGKGKKR